MVGYVTGSAYEVQAHTRFALQAGVRIEQIHELTNFETSVVYDDRERAVLRYAAQVTRRNCISTEVTVQLHRLFDRKTRLELALQVGFYNMVIRILGAFGIEPVSTL